LTFTAGMAAALGIVLADPSDLADDEPIVRAGHQDGS